jgi:hypothetical protein
MTDNYGLTREDQPHLDASKHIEAAVSKLLNADEQEQYHHHRNLTGLSEAISIKENK